MDLIERDVRPSQIITKESLENSIALVAASGGSTNAVLHLMALAHEMGVELSLDDFDRIAWNTPLIVDLKPGGRFVATDLYEAGGVRAIAKRPPAAGYLHGDAPPVTRRPLAGEA